MWHRNEARAIEWTPDPSTLHERVTRDWAIWWDGRARVHLEKSIVHSCWMPTLDAAFPNTRFVFVLRNGFCAAEGIMRRAAPGPVAAAQLGRSTYSPEDAGRQWLASNAPLLTGEGRPDRLHIVRYEEFVADPVRTIRDVLDVLRVDAAPLKDLGGGRLTMAGRPFTITNDNATSLARLSAENRTRLEDVLGNGMEKLGYPRDGGAGG